MRRMPPPAATGSTLPVDDGALALVAGDVVGNGASALAAAGQLRSAVLLAVSRTPTPPRSHASRPVRRGGARVRWRQHLPGSAPGERAFRYAVAGYPPPFVVDRTGADDTAGPDRRRAAGLHDHLRQRRRRPPGRRGAARGLDGFQLPAGRDPCRPRVTSTRGVPSCSTAYCHRAGASTTPSCSACAAVPARAAGAAQALPDTVRRRPPRGGGSGYVARAWSRSTSAVVQAVSRVRLQPVEHAYPQHRPPPDRDHRHPAGLTTRVRGGARPPATTVVGGHPSRRRSRTRPAMSREFVDDLRIDTGASGDPVPSGTAPSVDLRAQRATVRVGQRRRPGRLALDVSGRSCGVRGRPVCGGRAPAPFRRVSAARTRAATVDLAAVTSLCRAAVEAISSAAPVPVAGAPADRRRRRDDGHRVLTWAGIPHQGPRVRPRGRPPTRPMRHRDQAHSDQGGFETRCDPRRLRPHPSRPARVIRPSRDEHHKQDGVGGPRGGYEYSWSANPTRTALGGQHRRRWRGRAASRSPPGSRPRTPGPRLCRPGDHVVLPDDAYGGTFRLFDKVATRSGAGAQPGAGLRPDAVPPRSGQEHEAGLGRDPTNPLLNIGDIAGAGRGRPRRRRAARRRQHLRRRTSSSRWRWRRRRRAPTTKYCGGHRRRRRRAGRPRPDLAEVTDHLPPERDGAVAGRSTPGWCCAGLKTLALRMDRHCDNAEAIVGVPHQPPGVVAT